MSDERAKKASHDKVAPGQNALTGLEDEVGYDVCLLADPRHEVFCREFAIFRNGTRAYMKAFPRASVKTAGANAHELLKKTEIKERVTAITADRLDALDVTHERIVQEVAKLAFLDPAEYYDESGCAKPIHEIDPFARAALESVKIKRLDVTPPDSMTKTFVTITEIKHANKKGALELLMRYKEMIKDNVNVNHGGVVGVTDDATNMELLREKFRSAKSGAAGS
jgi:phage terminase small subunit